MDTTVKKEKPKKLLAVPNIEKCSFKISEIEHIKIGKKHSARFYVSMPNIKIPVETTIAADSESDLVNKVTDFFALKEVITFTYQGHTFQPAGTIKEVNSSSQLTALSKKLKRLNPVIANEHNGGSGWNPTEFYKQAAAAGVGKVDLFIMDGATTVIPLTNELYEYKR